MIIDNKGRIFGKINIIDFLVVLFILVLVPLFFIGNKILSAKKVEVVAEETPLTVEVRFSKIMPELANVLQEGDLQRNEMGNIVGKLVKIVSNEPTKIQLIELSGYSGNKFDISDSDCREIKALFELICVKRSGNFIYGGHIIKIGNQVSFSTDLYSIQGVITGVKR